MIEIKEIKKDLIIRQFNELINLDEKEIVQVQKFIFLQFKTKINDDEFSQVSFKLEKMINLQTLQMSFFECENLQNAVNIKQIMKQLSKLTSLQLNFRQVKQLTNNSIQEIIESLENLLNLETFSIDFYGCSHIHDENLDKLLQQLKRMNSLTQVRLLLGWNNNLTQQIVPNIVSYLEYNKNIKLLCLSFHYLKNITSVNQLGFALGNLEQLTNLTLNLGGCQLLQSADINIVIKNLQNLINLEQLLLNLQQCELVNDGNINQLGSSLKSLQNLKQLSIDIGQLKIEDVEEFGLSLRTLTKLNYLSINTSLCSRLRKGIVGKYFGEIKELQKLFFNFQSCSSITQENFFDFTEDLSKLQSLKLLKINFQECSNMNEVSYLSVAKSISKLDNLIFLNLQLSQIQNNWLDEIIKSVKKIKSILNIIILYPLSTTYQEDFEQIENQKYQLMKMRYLVKLKFQIFKIIPFS